MTTVELNESTANALKWIGSMIAQYRPDLNHLLTDDFVASAAVIYLKLMMVEGTEHYTPQDLIAHSFTLAMLGNITDGQS